jgi:transposase
MVIAIGVDTHKDTLAACVVDGTGRALAERTFSNDRGAHGALLEWVRAIGGRRRFGIEGAGGFGAGLARALEEAEEDVREVPSVLTNRERRRIRRPGKSDPADALAIARVVARESDLPPVPAEGISRDLKLLVDYRDQLIHERTRVQNRLHADLTILLPGYRRHVPRLVTRSQLLGARRILKNQAGVRSELALSRLRRLEALDAEITELKRKIVVLVGSTATTINEVPGVGPITAAKVLGEVGDVRRFRSKGAFAMAAGVAPVPASSGQTQRHRLNRGGNRQLNKALHTIALIQRRVDPRAKTYVERKRAEGKSTAEAVRCLKRHLADTVYLRLVRDNASSMLLDR